MDSPTAQYDAAMPPTPAHAARGTTSLRSRLARLRVWLGPLAGFALSVYSLVAGVERQRADAYCRHPLAPYLIASACLGLVQCVVLLLRHRAAAGNAESTALRLLLLLSLLLFVAMVAWTVVGAVWVFSVDASQCDSTLEASAKSVVIVNLVVVALVSASIARTVQQRRRGQANDADVRHGGEQHV